MTLMLAEISDKMPTIGEHWAWMFFFSLPVLIGIVDRRVALVLLVVAWSFSILVSWSACYDAFFEPVFSDAVQNEMGREWITNSIASAWLPGTVALAVYCWHLKSGVACPNGPLKKLKEVSNSSPHHEQTR